MVLSRECEVALQAWGLMGNELKFHDIDSVGEYLSVSDYDILISLLIQIKSFCDEKIRADNLK